LPQLLAVTLSRSFRPDISLLLPKLMVSLPNLMRLDLSGTSQDISLMLDRIRLPTSSPCNMQLFCDTGQIRDESEIRGPWREERLSNELTFHDRSLSVGGTTWLSYLEPIVTALDCTLIAVKSISLPCEEINSVVLHHFTRVLSRCQTYETSSFLTGRLLKTETIVSPNSALRFVSASVQDRPSNISGH
ncbi:hypothetical protein K443DRAFT_684995, partial [Laccaria amethystina LaAM-08-1]